MSSVVVAKTIPSVIQDMEENDSVLLRFYEHNGRVMSWYNGSPVYGHKNYDPIEAGESWYCRLATNVGTNGKNYFAVPLERVCADFLYGLSPEHRVDLAKIILEEFPEEVRNLIGGTVEDAEPQVDPQSSIHQERTTGVVVESRVSTISDESEEGPYSAIDDLSSVVRTGPTTLGSNQFASGRFDVYISRDHKTIRVIQRTNGALNCGDHTLVIPGLEQMVPYNETAVYSHFVNERSGAITITVC